MPLFRLRVYWEDDDQIYRDIEIQSAQTFADLHETIVKAFEFDGKHPASFFESDDKWNRSGRELSSEVLVNKKDAPALSMVKTPIGALITIPGQKFLYEYRSAKRTWNFWVELIGIEKTEHPKRTYPFVAAKEGVAPAQYGIKGISPDRMPETELVNDLGADEIAEGYGSEGEGSSSSGEAEERYDSSSEEEY